MHKTDNIQSFTTSAILNQTEENSMKKEHQIGIEEDRSATFVFNMTPQGLHDLFREFDEAMEQIDTPEGWPRIWHIRTGELV